MGTYQSTANNYSMPVYQPPTYVMQSAPMQQATCMPQQQKPVV